MKNKKIVYVSALFGFIISCSPKIAPVVEQVHKVTLTPELAEGKSLYENNCGKCHQLYEPNSYSKENWIPILKSMQIKAEITDAEREKIYNYLTKE